MESNQKSKKATLRTSNEKVRPEDLADIVKRVGKQNVRQICSFGDEIRMNFKHDFNIEGLDNLEDVVINSGVRIQNVEYEGKKPKTLISIVGQDFDTPDVEVFTQLESIILTTYGTVYRSKYNRGDLKGIYIDKRTILAYEIPNKELFGSYQRILGQKVRVFHHGVTTTCGWCYLTETLFPSEADFFTCKAQYKGIKPNFEDQMDLIDREREA